MTSQQQPADALAGKLKRTEHALDIPRAILAGYDWGGRAACVAAALWPQRWAGIVAVGSYLIQDIAAAMTPIRPDLEAGLWYFFYFLTERGRAGLTANRRDIAQVIWTRTEQPAITVPAVTLDGLADGNFPATDGSASHLTSPGPACTTRCRAPGTTFPRSLQKHSPARSWNWPACATDTSHPRKEPRQ